MLLCPHALAIVTVHVESATVMDVVFAHVVASAPIRLADRACLSVVLVALFRGLAVAVVTSGDDLQVLTVLHYPLAHVLRHPLHLHP
jgi:hypothetical protein